MLQLLALVVELLVVVDGGLLVLLVLGDQVVHVGLRLGELHLVHALASVPVEESLCIAAVVSVQIIICKHISVNPPFS